MLLKVIAFILLVSYFIYHVFFERTWSDIAYSDCYIVEPVGRYRCRIHDVRTGKSFTMRLYSNPSRWSSTVKRVVENNLYKVRINYKLRMILERYYPDIYKRYLCDTLTEMPE